MTRQQTKIGLWDVVKSVLAAMFGVQSNKNRERDFQYGNPLAYILVGLIMVIMFILIIVIVVNLVVPD